MNYLPTLIVCRIRKLLAKAQDFERLANELNLDLIGSTEKNHWRVTGLGSLRGAWLSPNSVPTVQGNEPFPHKRIAVLGIEGYHDFQPQLLAANLVLNPQFEHCEVTSGFLNIPQLDELRKNAREFRSVNISQLLEHKLAFNDLVKEIIESAQGAEAVFLPACFGLENQEFMTALRDATKLALFELPTLPPSLLGMRQRIQLRHKFESLGGRMINGDSALSANLKEIKYFVSTLALLKMKKLLQIILYWRQEVSSAKGLFPNLIKFIEPVLKYDIGVEGFNDKDRFTSTVWSLLIHNLINQQA